MANDGWQYMMNESFMQQKVNPNPTEMILKIRWISDLPKIVGFQQHSNSDSNSDTSLDQKQR